jgi:hypothetical protein
MQVLATQNVATWGEMCVGVWLEQNGFQDLIKPLSKNGINGEALGSLSEADLVAMKVDKLAVREKETPPIFCRAATREGTLANRR